MKILYMDCNAGISGDMALGAFLDLGVPESVLRDGLAQLGLSGWNISWKKNTHRGIAGTDVTVALEDQPDAEWESAQAHHAARQPEHHEHPHGEHGHHEHGHEHPHGEHGHHEHGHEHPHEHHEHPHAHPHTAQGESVHSHGTADHAHNTWRDIRAMIQRSGLSDHAKALAIRIFERVAVAEARVHDRSLEEVAFHEVGAVDSIIDIVGAAICLDWLRVEKIVVSPIHTGTGTVWCQHGRLPVPAPATANILADRQAPAYSDGTKGEMATPTGVAIACEMAQDFGGMPLMRVLKTGYGLGKKDFGLPNAVRLMLGESIETAQPVEAKTADGTLLDVVVLEAQMDDMTGEMAGRALQVLMREGALDVCYTPVVMKKNRPGWLMTVIVAPHDVSRLEGVMFRETTTIGIRRHAAARSVMDRTRETVSLPEGDVDLKVSRREGVVRAMPEYDSVVAVADRSGKPFSEIYAKAQAAWLSH